MTGTDAAPASEALDFSPAILRLQRQPPSPLPRTILYLLLALVGGLLVWSFFGRLDIIAVAPAGWFRPATSRWCSRPTPASSRRSWCARATW